MTLQLTEAAATRIAHFISLDEQAKGFRVTIKKMGCSGWGYDVSIAQEINEGDVLLEDKGITLIVPKEAMDKIQGTTIDYQKQGINQIFVYENPNATGECGCGESFTTN